MKVQINGEEYEIGEKINYAQKNQNGEYQDKFKYRIAQNNNKIVIVLQAMAQMINQLSESIKSVLMAYIWAGDNGNTIMACDENTMLVFYSDTAKIMDELQTRMDTVEEDIGTIADTPVLTYGEKED